jgi:DNA-binding MarR family transcriptional regulator
MSDSPDEDFAPFDGDTGEAGLASVNLGPLARFPGYLFRRAQLRIYNGLYPLLSPYGIRPTQLGVLLLLKYNPGIKPSEVSATLGLQRTNFAPMLMELRNRGLAESRAGTEDKRTRCLFLTPRGETLLERLEGEAAAYETKMAEAIDPNGLGLLDGLANWLTKG